MHQYNPTAPQQAVEDYIRQNKRKKAILLLTIPPSIMIVSYLAVPLLQLIGSIPGSTNLIEDIGYGAIVIYYVGVAIGSLAFLLWIPCAVVGTILLLSTNLKK